MALEAHSAMVMISAVVMTVARISAPMIKCVAVYNSLLIILIILYWEWFSFETSIYLGSNIQADDG